LPGHCRSARLALERHVRACHAIAGLTQRFMGVYDLFTYKINAVRIREPRA